MSKTVYEHLKDLPRGQAEGEVLTDVCLVLEGGAFRGVYTSGVIDVLMENHLIFGTTVGVSAGALNGFNYAAGQIGRASLINLGYRQDKRYVGIGNYRKDGNVIGYTFLFDTFNSVYPFNEKEFYSDKKRFVAVTTELETGKAVFFESHKDKDVIFDALKASSSMPYVSKAVEIRSKHYLDGGIALKLAYPWAIEEGYKKIVIVRTNAKDYVRKYDVEKERRRAKFFYKKYPEFVETLATSNKRYNDQHEEVKKLEEEGKAFVIYPSEPVTVSQLEKDMDALGHLYELGVKDTLAALPALKAYLAK